MYLITFLKYTEKSIESNMMELLSSLANLNIPLYLL